MYSFKVNSIFSTLILGLVKIGNDVTHRERKTQPHLRVNRQRVLWYFPHFCCLLLNKFTIFKYFVVSVLYRIPK